MSDTLPHRLDELTNIGRVERLELEGRLEITTYDLAGRVIHAHRDYSPIGYIRTDTCQYDSADVVIFCDTPTLEDKLSVPPLIPWSPPTTLCGWPPTLPPPIPLQALRAMSLVRRGNIWPGQSPEHFQYWQRRCQFYECTSHDEILPGSSPITEEIKLTCEEVYH